MLQFKPLFSDLEEQRELRGCRSAEQSAGEIFQTEIACASKQPLKSLVYKRLFKIPRRQNKYQKQDNCHTGGFHQRRPFQKDKLILTPKLDEIQHQGTKKERQDEEHSMISDGYIRPVEQCLPQLQSYSRFPTKRDPSEDRKGKNDDCPKPLPPEGLMLRRNNRPPQRRNTFNN
jgi:hypothetical protein